MKHSWLLILILFFIPAYMQAAVADSVCESPLRFDVLAKNANVDAYLWTAGDRRYNVYYKDSNLVVENKRSKAIWLIHGYSFASYPNSELFIDTVYFKNISESNQKELMIRYSLFSLRQSGTNTKSKHLLIADLSERKIILNIATYDFKIGKDENGRVIDNLYEAEVDISHNYIQVTSTEDSDIDNPAIQLDDGIYHRRGHCFVKH